MFSASPVVRAIRTVVTRPAEHHQPDIGSAEISAVTHSLLDVTNYKPVNDLEVALAKVCKVGHAVATTSGSAALEVALHVVGVRRGEIVLVPSMAFVAAANAVKHLGATPIFVDSLFQDFGINPHKLGVLLDREAQRSDRGPIHKSGARIAAIIAVHVFGVPCAMDRIAAISWRWGLPIVEDAAEALGSALYDKPCGSWGNVAVLSFNYNKVVTGGGGGALLTNSADLAHRARHLVTTARVKHPWEVGHDDVAWNYRMPTYVAALVGAQLARLPILLERKRALADAYHRALADVPGIVVHRQQEKGISNHWLNTLLIDPRWVGGRDEILAGLHEHHIKARAAFTPIHMLPPYENDAQDNCEVAKDIHRRAVCLPSGSSLGERFVR